MDLKTADSILIMGSNMAECHPVAFRWVMQAKTRPNNPCHGHPRRSALHAHLGDGQHLRPAARRQRHRLPRRPHQPRPRPARADLRARPEPSAPPRERFFHDYLVHYTNAATLITEEFKDTEDDDWPACSPASTPSKRTVRREEVALRQRAAERRSAEDAGGKPGEGRPQSFSGQVGKLVGPPPKTGPDAARRALRLPDPARGTTSATRRSWSRRSAARRARRSCKVAEALLDNAGPDRTGAICYAVGWTQHTTGVQMIRAAAILQLLLGNVGRPGGGILALRGHATIQGSTDIATLYNLLPGYLQRRPAPCASTTRCATTSAPRRRRPRTGRTFPKFIVSQLKAWFGDDGHGGERFRLRLPAARSSATTRTCRCSWR